MYATPAETPSPYASLPEDEWCRNNSMLAGCLDPQRTMYATPEQTLIPYPSPDQTASMNADYERLLQASLAAAKINGSSKLSTWQWTTIGAGSTAVVLGGVVAGVLIHQHIRVKNLIQFEMIDDPALGHTLI
jgi:hypothetical protein